MLSNFTNNDFVDVGQRIQVFERRPLNVIIELQSHCAHSERSPPFQQQAAALPAGRPVRRRHRHLPHHRQVVRGGHGNEAAGAGGDLAGDEAGTGGGSQRSQAGGFGKAAQIERESI